MNNHEMNMNELANVTLITGKLIESPIAEFLNYLDEQGLGVLLGISNYLKAEYERVRQVKDHLLENPMVKRKDPQALKTLDGLYSALTVLEARHDIVNKFIDFRHKGISTEPILNAFITPDTKEGI